MRTPGDASRFSVRRWARRLAHAAMDAGLVESPRWPHRLADPSTSAQFMAIHAAARPIAILGHRGAGGMAPGNTLAAFAAGLRVGLDHLEMDARMTRDGVVVITHEKAVPDRCRGPYVGREITALTFDQLRHMDYGYPSRGTASPAPGSPAPTIDEVMAFVESSGNTHTGLVIDAKRPLAGPTSSADFARGIIDAAVRHGMVDRVVLMTKDWNMIKAVNDGHVTPTVALAPVIGSFSRGHLGGADPADFGGVLGMAQAYGAMAISIDTRMLSEALADDAHARRLLVWAWTTNTAQSIADAVAAGADGVVTDYPKTARALLARHQPLPQGVRAKLNYPKSYVVRSSPSISVVPVADRPGRPRVRPHSEDHPADE